MDTSTPSSTSSSASSATTSSPSNTNLADFLAKQNIEGMTTQMISILVGIDAYMKEHYGETMLKRRAMANYEYREKVKKELKEAEKNGLLEAEIAKEIEQEEKAKNDALKTE